MGVEKILALLDKVIYASTGKHLSDLQSEILRGVWQGKKYVDIADEYGCTEGHAKDIASLMWKLLSKALGEKINKSNFRAAIARYLSKQSENILVPTFPILGRDGLLHSEDTYSEATSEFSLPQGTASTISDKQIDLNFIGREKAIAHLDTLVSQASKVIVIQGEGGVGKTTLAQQYLQSQGFELILELLMAKETQNIISVESIVEEWLQRDLDDDSGGELGVILLRLKRHLQQRRIGILIDNLEPALDRYGKLIASHRNYVELLRVLADARVRSTTIITSRDRLCESDLNVEHYRLSGLDKQAWQQFFSFRQINSDESVLKQIHQTYGGNAKAMGIICGAIAEDFQGDLNTYWQENQGDPLVEINLKNLVVSQFNRLQNLDFEAYQLLCRLGCFRYQDVPAVGKEALLFLLWDVDSHKRRRTIESLRNRSLVEFSGGKYWLHPVIRAEAISRLRMSEEWEETNLKIARFWTDSVKSITSLQDALTALEAYYHYLEIEDFAEAGKVILNSRNNQWGQYLTLGGTLYRMGLLQLVLEAIEQIIDRAQSDRALGELNNILGDLYWITGRVREAIACQEKTIQTATRSLQGFHSNSDNGLSFYYFRMLEVDSLLSIGLYEIDLWELEKATSYFQQVISLANNTAHQRWAQKALVCLALVNSYLGFPDKAVAVADAIYQNILEEKLGEHTGRFAYFIQIIGQIYFNLGNLDRALQMYEKAIIFSQESHYNQVKAKSLSGLAAIHCQEKQFNLAISSHLEAIEILEKIGAKCDLAEAYFQLGLTYQKMAKLSKSETCFAEAIKLFREIDAPRQVEKVSAFCT
jgi:tetratricopeptide (TPR) repeat protein